MKNELLITQTFRDLKADYDGMRPSKFRRERRNLGGSADAHLGYSWVQYWKLRETSRDMMRNDGIIGQALERACDNIFGDGFQLECQTSDRVLNQEIDEAFSEWSNDPFQCDAREILTFNEQARLAWTQTAFDGDTFANPHEDGFLQWIEGERCVTAKNTKKKIVHGVVLGDRDEPIEYWFARDYLPYERLMHVQLVSETTPVKAKNEFGEPNVFHLYKSSRFSATRGVPLFAACFDTAGMLEDLNFAKLVQAQVVSCIAAFIETEIGAKGNTPAIGGAPKTQTKSDGTTEIIENLQPGKVPQLPPGKTMKPFSPSVPNSEYFQHVTLLLRIIGANIGLPLSIVLLDMNDANFSSARFGLEQARMGFKKNQQFMINRLFRPTLRWKIRQFQQEKKISGESVNKMMKTGEIFKHKWIPSGWPYIEPAKDANADTVMQVNMLDSSRGIQARKGRDYDEVLDEADY